MWLTKDRTEVRSRWCFSCSCVSTTAKRYLLLWLGKIDERTLLLCKILRWSFLILTLILEYLDLVLAAEIIATAAAAHVRHYYFARRPSDGTDRASTPVRWQVVAVIIYFFIIYLLPSLTLYLYFFLSVHSLNFISSIS